MPFTRPRDVPTRLGTHQWACSVLPPPLGSLLQFHFPGPRVQWRKPEHVLNGIALAQNAQDEEPWVKQGAVGKGARETDGS